MQNILNRYSSKLSQNTFLSSPPDDTNMGTGQGSQQNNNQQTLGDDDQNAAGDGDEDDQGVTDDDVKSLLGKSGFEIDEDDVDTEEAKTARASSHEALSNQLRTSLESFKFDEEDIMADYDPSDRSSVAKMLSNVHKKSISKNMELTIPIIEQAMKVTVEHVSALIEAKLGRNQKKSEAETVFEELGFTVEADKALAKSIFQNALSSKMSPAKAAAATKQAMKTLGKTGTAKKKGGVDSKGVRTGVDALKDMFG